MTFLSGKNRVSHFLRMSYAMIIQILLFICLNRALLRHSLGVANLTTLFFINLSGVQSIRLLVIHFIIILDA